MKPIKIVAVVCAWQVAVMLFPALGYGWPGLIGGCVTVALLYLLLKHTPEKAGNWASKGVEGRD